MSEISIDKTKIIEKTKNPKKRRRISKGKQFLMQFGFSKSLKKAMVKAGVYKPTAIKESLESYRKLRRERKKELDKIRKQKRVKALAGRSSAPKKK